MEYFNRVILLPFKNLDKIQARLRHVVQTSVTDNLTQRSFEKKVREEQMKLDELEEHGHCCICHQQGQHVEGRRKHDGGMTLLEGKDAVIVSAALGISVRGYLCPTCEIIRTKIKTRLQAKELKIQQQAMQTLQQQQDEGQFVHQATSAGVVHHFVPGQSDLRGDGGGGGERCQNNNSNIKSNENSSNHNHNNNNQNMLDVKIAPFVPGRKGAASGPLSLELFRGVTGWPMNKPLDLRIIAPSTGSEHHLHHQLHLRNVTGHSSNIGVQILASDRVSLVLSVTSEDVQRMRRKSHKKNQEKKRISKASHSSQGLLLPSSQKNDKNNNNDSSKKNAGKDNNDTILAKIKKMQKENEKGKSHKHDDDDDDDEFGDDNISSASSASSLTSSDFEQDELEDDDNDNNNNNNENEIHVMSLQSVADFSTIAKKRNQLPKVKHQSSGKDRHGNQNLFFKIIQVDARITERRRRKMRREQLQQYYEIETEKNGGKPVPIKEHHKKELEYFEFIEREENNTDGLLFVSKTLHEMQEERNKQERDKRISSAVVNILGTGHSANEKAKAATATASSSSDLLHSPTKAELRKISEAKKEHTWAPTDPILFSNFVGHDSTGTFLVEVFEKKTDAEASSSAAAKLLNSHKKFHQQQHDHSLVLPNAAKPTTTTTTSPSASSASESAQLLAPPPITARKCDIVKIGSCSFRSDDLRLATVFGQGPLELISAVDSYKVAGYLFLKEVIVHRYVDVVGVVSKDETNNNNNTAANGVVSSSNNETNTKNNSNDNNNVANNNNNNIDQECRNMEEERKNIRSKILKNNNGDDFYLSSDLTLDSKLNEQPEFLPAWAVAAIKQRKCDSCKIREVILFHRRYKELLCSVCKGTRRHQAECLPIGAAMPNHEVCLSLTMVVSNSRPNDRTDPAYNQECSLFPPQPDLFLQQVPGQSNNSNHYGANNLHNTQKMKSTIRYSEAEGLLNEAGTGGAIDDRRRLKSATLFAGRNIQLRDYEEVSQNENNVNDPFKNVSIPSSSCTIAAVVGAHPPPPPPPPADLFSVCWEASPAIRPPRNLLEREQLLEDVHEELSPQSRRASATSSSTFYPIPQNNNNHSDREGKNNNKLEENPQPTLFAPITPKMLSTTLNNNFGNFFDKKQVDDDDEDEDNGLHRDDDVNDAANRNNQQDLFFQNLHNNNNNNNNNVAAGKEYDTFTGISTYDDDEDDEEEYEENEDDENNININRRNNNRNLIDDDGILLGMGGAGDSVSNSNSPQRLNETTAAFGQFEQQQQQPKKQTPGKKKKNNNNSSGRGRNRGATRDPSGEQRNAVPMSHRHISNNNIHGDMIEFIGVSASTDIAGFFPAAAEQQSNQGNSTLESPKSSTTSNNHNANATSKLVSYENLNSNNNNASDNNNAQSSPSRAGTTTNGNQRFTAVVSASNLKRHQQQYPSSSTAKIGSTNPNNFMAGGNNNNMMINAAIAAMNNSQTWPGAVSPDSSSLSVVSALTAHSLHQSYNGAVGTALVPTNATSTAANTTTSKNAPTPSSTPPIVAPPPSANVARNNDNQNNNIVQEKSSATASQEKGQNHQEGGDDSQPNSSEKKQKPKTSEDDAV